MPKPARITLATLTGAGQPEDWVVENVDPEMWAEWLRLHVEQIAVATAEAFDKEAFLSWVREQEGGWPTEAMPLHLDDHAAQTDRAAAMEHGR